MNKVWYLVYLDVIYILFTDEHIFKWLNSVCVTARIYKHISSCERSPPIFFCNSMTSLSHCSLAYYVVYVLRAASSDWNLWVIRGTF